MVVSRKAPRALAVAVALGLCVLPRPAAAQELLTNGGFETGTLAGWSAVNRPPGAQYDPNTPASGSFVIDDNADALTPLSGLSTLGPRTGAFYALSDATAQGTHVLLQSFTVPLTATSVLLSFDMYVYDWFGAGAAIDPSGLDHTSGGTGAPNQHARVDLLTAGAGTFDTGAGSVLANFYLGVDPESAQNPPQAAVYRPYAFDLTPFVVPGLAYQLRFGEVDNQFVINQAVDNVSVRAAPVAAGEVPEPGTAALLLASGLPLAAVRLRRKTARR
jgi:hypothetical protein